MTRSEIVRLVVQQAVRNGFDFKHWCNHNLGLHWTSDHTAIETLTMERRYFSLLFSHEFARYFWQQGSPIAFVVPAVSYSRCDKHGNTIMVERKPYIRRKVKADAWKYHLREMAICDEPLRYMRRFIVPAAVHPSPAVHSSRKNQISTAARNDSSDRRHGRSPLHL